MVSFPQVSPPISTPPYALHAPPISFFSILSPGEYWVRNTDHSAPHCAVSSTPWYPVPPRPKYSPQHPTLEHPRPVFLPQCQRPSFAPIQNNRQNYSSIYLTMEPASERVRTWGVCRSCFKLSSHAWLSIYSSAKQHFTVSGHSMGASFTYLGLV